MATEYSYIEVQTVEPTENLFFNNGGMCCRKGIIDHKNNSGIFRIKGTGCKSIYRVSFNGNIAVATGGTVGAVSVALVQNGEVLRNAIVTVTPAAVGEFNNVAMSIYITLPCGCCDTISLRNISTTAIDVENANIMIDRIAQKGENQNEKPL